MADENDKPDQREQEPAREASGIPTVKDVRIQSVGVRPDLFQARDTSGSASYSEDRVKEIVANWNPERFDPIAVVSDPEQPGEYIVIGGHHRLEAVKRLNLPTVPVRVLSGDIRDTEERQRLEREAVVSNFGVAESNLRERVTAAGRLSDSGLSNRAIATEMRSRPVEADRLLWLRRLPPGIVERAMIQPELTPAAAELGRAMEKHGLGEEAVGGLFTRWVRDYDETGKIPGQYVLRQQLDALAGAGRDAEGSQEGFGGLAGFGGDATLGAFDTERKNAEQIETRLRGTRQRLTSCQSLADELGVDIKDVHVAAGAVLDELTAEQAKAVRTTLALHRSQTTGEGPEAGQEQDPAPATDPDPPSFAGMGPPAEQPGLSNDFATNRNFAMPMDGGQGAAAPPLADPEVLAAEQERRDILVAGGIDMFGSASDPTTYPAQQAEEQRIDNAQAAALDGKITPADAADTAPASRTNESTQKGLDALERRVSESKSAKGNQSPSSPGSDKPSGKLYQGHKGPGIGFLKQDRPDLSDGDSDTVVAERRPRKGDVYSKSHVALPKPGRASSRTRPKGGPSGKARIVVETRNAR